VAKIRSRSWLDRASTGSPKQGKRDNNEQRKEREKMNEVVGFTIDTPVEVALRFETGKHVEGRYGDGDVFTPRQSRHVTFRRMWSSGYKSWPLQPASPCTSANSPRLMGTENLSNGASGEPRSSGYRRQTRRLPRTRFPNKTQNHGNGSANGDANGSDDERASPPYRT
jgi:hypothetical protein